MAQNKGLGRGLDALLSSADDVSNSESNLQNCKIDNLVTGKYQPRTHMNEKALKELAESIKAQGIMQPIVVRYLDNKRYEIIAGERRWRAAKIANLDEVPILIKNIPDESALAMALIENIQREDLNAIEEAKGIQRLIDEFGMTHESASEILGKSRTTITNLLRLLSLSQHVQNALLDGKIEMGHARAIIPLASSEQAMICQKIISQKLSVREVEALIGNRPSAKVKIRENKSSDILSLENDLSDKLGTSVKISHKKNGTGALKINYSNLDQLDSIIKKLNKNG
ncbi:MAG: chromosome partitioning protein ParB [Acidimicrobiaceae bacterium]|nr:chromosome partitioning protein ParB [Acidimicrobiaceae bacterium]